MKKQFLIAALLFVGIISSYSQNSYVQITSVIPESIEVGSTLKVTYKYTSDKEINILYGINLLDKWEWVSFLGGKNITVPAGKDVESTFEIFIPKKTRLTADLKDELNYKLKLEMKSGNEWICGDYPKEHLNFIAAK